MTHDPAFWGGILIGAANAILVLFFFALALRLGRAVADWVSSRD